MKVSELMIGDWVYSSFSSYPCKITHIGSFGDEYIEVGVTGVLGLKDIASLTPIPLTQEILEKNEFEQIRDVGYFFEDRCEKKVIYNFFCQRLKIISDYDTLLNIKYFGGINLHEFQHILKICDIDKEIVL